jgi:hypothetical protein
VNLQDVGVRLCAPLVPASALAITQAPRARRLCVCHTTAQRSHFPVLLTPTLQRGSQRLAGNTANLPRTGASPSGRSMRECHAAFHRPTGAPRAPADQPGPPLACSRGTGHVVRACLCTALQGRPTPWSRSSPSRSCPCRTASVRDGQWRPKRYPLRRPRQLCLPDLAPQKPNSALGTARPGPRLPALRSRRLPASSVHQARDERVDVVEVDQAVAVDIGV